MEDEDRVSLSNSRSAQKPTKVYAIWGSVTAAIVLGLGGVGVAFPASGAMDTLGKIDIAKAETVTSQAQLVELKVKEEGLAAAKATVAKFIAKFPPGADQKQLVDDLSRYANDSNVKIVSINTSAPTVLGANGTVGPAVTAAPPVEDPNADPLTKAAPAAPGAEFPLAEVVIDITLTGDYDSTTKFVKNMEGGRRSFVIDSLSVSPDGAGGGNTSIKARSFIARKLDDPTAVPTQDAAKTPDANQAAPAK